MLINIITDYLCYGLSRGFLALIKRWNGFLVRAILLIADAFATFCVSWAVLTAPVIAERRTSILRWSAVWDLIGGAWHDRFFFIVYPAFFTCIWLWLYAGSGFLLKAARRFDIGFEWFNRKFDIEKKPLQSIGLVAGALVAVVYWAVALVVHLV